jgi:tetratricopeptide (TPR) repeat protein
MMCSAAVLRLASLLTLALLWAGLRGEPQVTPAAESAVPASPLDEIVNIDLRADVRVFTVMAAAAAAGYGPRPEDRSPVLSSLLADLSGLDPGLVDHLRATFTAHRFRDETARQTAYISLAILLNDPPEFGIREDAPEIPPDVGRILGFEKLLPAFYREARIEELWARYRSAYLAELEAYRPVLRSVIRDTLDYFRIPARVVLDRRIVLIPNLLSLPDVVHARNMERTYYIVVGPADDPASNYVQLQHEYLHFLIDPMMEKYGGMILRERSLLDLAHDQPYLARDFRGRFILIVGESLIEAILHRLHPSEEWDSRLVELFRRGLIFVPFFTRSLNDFERNPELPFPVFLEDAIGTLQESAIHDDARKVDEIEGRIEAVRIAELEELERRREDRRRSEEIAGLLDAAGRALSRGDYAEAETRLGELLELDSENGHAFFYLGQAAAQRGNFDEAYDHYLRAERSEGVEPWVRAWSSVRIGRQLAFRGAYGEARERFEAVVAIGDDLNGARRAALDSLAQLPEVDSP